MLEYILQTIFLISVLFVYMLAGSVVYSAVGEGYKSTPLRCFAVGVGLWVLLVILSTVFFKVSLEYLWFGYFCLALFGLLNLPTKDQEETLDKKFFYQVLVSFCIILPVFIFLAQDKMHLWQEFAIYGKGLFSLLEHKEVTPDLLAAPLAYQLAILPVGYFVNIQNNIFACFNAAIIAFVACEFVRNSGVRMQTRNVTFPLVVAFTLLVVFNPFSVRDLILSADPFIFICGVGFAFAEYIFRSGYLPKNVAAFPPAVILMLLAFSSTQGFLLSCSLFVVLLVRYLIQISRLNHKQLIGFGLIPAVPVFVMLLWQFYLNQRGLGFLLFDVSKVTPDNIALVYKAFGVLAKHHYVEVCYILLVLIAGICSFIKVKKADDLIIDKYLLTSVFWVVLIYVFVCVPVFFTQYDYVARASYSLGFTSIALIQFIILMPIGRLIKENIEKIEVDISGSIKFTVIIALLVFFVMNRHYLQADQNYKITNIMNIGDYIHEKLPAESKIAVVDIKKTGMFYKYILDFKNISKQDFVVLDSAKLPSGVQSLYESLKSKKISYLVLHAPNNLLIKSFEHNFNPNFTYLYKIEKEGFYLIKKFENKLYKDTNIVIK